MDGADNNTPDVLANPAGPAPSAASPVAVAPEQPHARLLSMMQGLALGAGAFAHAAATGGREGGVQEVQEAQMREKEMKMRQQAAQQQAQEHDLRMKTGIADFNMKQAQLASFIHDMPLNHQKLSDEVQSSMIDLLQKKGVPLAKAVAHVEGQTTDQHISAVNTAANGDFTSNFVITTYGEKGVGGGSGNTYVVSNQSVMGMTLNKDDIGASLGAMSRVVDEAKTILGEKDPSVQKAAGQLALVNQGLSGGGSIGMPDWLRLSGTINTELHAAMSQKKEVQEFQTKQESLKRTQQENDPLFKLENDPGQMAGEKASSAIPLLQNKISAPSTSPEDKVRATRLLAQAKSAHQNFINDAVSKANAEQAAKQGDPRAAGKMLADGSLTLSDLKTRGMTPKFIMDAVNSAQSIDPKYKAGDEVIAEQVAKSPQTNQFFGSANSLIQKGGTLDQLQQAAEKLPDLHVPVFDKVADYLAAASGGKSIPGYTATLIGVADDYAKVMGGGQGSDTSRMQVYNSFAASLNQGQRQEAINNARKAVQSQVESRIGTNQFMRRIYGYALPGATKPFDPSKLPDAK